MKGFSTKQYGWVVILFLLANCSEERDFSYSVPENATTEEKENIDAGFQQWSAATGRRARTVNDGSETFSVVYGNPGSAYNGFSFVDWESNLDLSKTSLRKTTLIHAQIIISERHTDWPEELWGHVMLHEIGHGLGLGHSDDPDSVMCSKETFPDVTCNVISALDADTIAAARARLSDGWFGD